MRIKGVVSAEAGITRSELSRRVSGGLAGTPLSLGEAMRRMAKLDGCLGRKGNGHPGATVLWRGLVALAFSTKTYHLLHPSIPAGP
ncbi:MAG: IS4 family transposase [Gammaproteobacteria bacterium]